MQRKGLVIGILILLISVNIGSVFAGDVEVKSVSSVGFDGNTLYVGGSGPNNYTTIQSAIDDAVNGDTVFVYNGIYFENITIDKSIKLIGENKNHTIIDGKNVETDGVNLVLITSKDVIISDFTIKNSNFSQLMRFDIGISLSHSFNISIHDTIILECTRGIEVDTSSASIIHNTIKGHGDTGIGVWYSNATISYNVVDGDYGSNIFSCLSNTSIEKNIVTNSSTYGIHICDSLYKDGSNIIGNCIRDNSFGIFMDYCFSIKVGNNSFIDNRLDVLFGNCFFTKWSGNYWGRPRIFPKPILGFIWIYPSIPILNFDWNPAQEPYDIGV